MLSFWCPQKGDLLSNAIMQQSDGVQLLKLSGFDQDFDSPHEDSGLCMEKRDVFPSPFCHEGSPMVANGASHFLDPIGDPSCHSWRVRSQRPAVPLCR